MASIIAQITMMLVSTNMVPDVKHPQDLGKTQDALNPKILMADLSGIWGVLYYFARWKGNATRFKDKLVKMIKSFSCRFGDYTILSMIRPVLLHRGYEFVENNLFWSSFCWYRIKLVPVE